MGQPVGSWQRPAECLSSSSSMQLAAATSLPLGPRFLSATPCRLCFTTRKQIYKMKDLELALLRAFSKHSEQWLTAMAAG